MENEVTEANTRHDNLSHSTYLHPGIRTVDDIINWGLVKLGHPLITVELTREQMEMCLGDALEKYSKYASFPIEDIVVPLKGYDPKKGLDLSEYNITDIHDISFKRDTLLYGFGNDMFFGQYALMQSYAGSGIFPFFNNVGTSNGSWVSLHNLHEHFEMMNRVTGSMPQWRYFQNTKRLKITPTPCSVNKPSDVVLITGEVEPPPEELFGNEYVKRLFLALLKIQLGIIRKKFSSVQLIGGGQLDTSIGDEGKEEYNQIMEQMKTDESFGNICYAR